MKNTLLGRGILLPTGEISKDKINLVAGAVTQPFAEMVWATTGGDWETINRLTEILVTMNTAEDGGKLFNLTENAARLHKRAAFLRDRERRKTYPRAGLK